MQLHTQSSCVLKCTSQFRYYFKNKFSISTRRKFKESLRLQVSESTLLPSLPITTITQIKTFGILLFIITGILFEIKIETYHDSIRKIDKFGHIDRIESSFENRQYH